VSLENTIPNFIRAKSEKRLRQLIMINNVRLNMSYVAYNIVSHNGSWYAWYNEPLHQTPEVVKKLSPEKG
jgi:hypothetical protein